ncbi:complex I intermediate-associated protein 30, mitochondrial-like [Watersipora subatra]|uniref:complex I intermediate-associated protein 30, mitochondrial-like n=1 Tax=Watersipora subatra TaxID=2589382 RepID=UPI00355C0CAD
MRNSSHAIGLLRRIACHQCIVLQTCRKITVFEDDIKGPWKHKFKKPNLWARSKRAAKALPGELVKFREEVKEHFQPQHWEMENGDYKYQWRLNTQQAIDEWIVSTDQDMDQGYSTGKTTLSNQQCMLFHGFLNTKVPDDGKTRYAGYVNVKSPLREKSFARLESYDWTNFTHLIIRCRGDGRSYDLNLNMNNFYDIQWHDVYSFTLYTRGGPYWQIAKIPFSKFLLTSKGRLQDKQQHINLDRIKNFSITISDDAQGPFQLELDYIGLIYDAHHNNTFFYEMYDNDPLLS